MDESRKQFEEWMKYYHGIMPGDLCYASMVEMHWKAWQASRAAIEVDLAPANLLKCDGRDVVEILKYHGIKVKE
ncbi:TPA: hypothetical protein R4S50_002285 [Enterobacter cloacae subsp. cloacae]|nr:hypothetical protein [Enterobacter cloacae subsp. cloacae]HED2539741.1 hypothetical protein [Enterobacter cloacae subsp. cloacae]